MKRCRHCGRLIQEKRRNVFCSGVCELEYAFDRRVSNQRLNSFQILADTGVWVLIDNSTLYSLSNPERQVKVLERCAFTRNNKAYSAYRLTTAGYALLERWKSAMGVSV